MPKACISQLDGSTNLGANRMQEDDEWSCDEVLIQLEDDAAGKRARPDWIHHDGGLVES